MKSEFIFLVVALLLLSCCKYEEVDAKKDLALEFVELCKKEKLVTSDFDRPFFSNWDDSEKWAINAVWNYKKDPATTVIIHASKDGWWSMLLKIFLLRSEFKTAF